VSEQEQAARAIYESVRDRLVCDFATFASCLKDWRVVPLVQNNMVIGGVMTRDNEIHVGYKCRPCASILRHIKNTLGDILARFGIAVTYVMESNKRGLAFCYRLGFTPVDVKNGSVYMTCIRCPYV
jgi:hypothetical protein